jgi:hypothetical protein
VLHKFKNQILNLNALYKIFSFLFINDGELITLGRDKQRAAKRASATRNPISVELIDKFEIFRYLALGFKKEGEEEKSVLLNE